MRWSVVRSNVLMNSGAQSEKDLKEYLVAKFRELGLKVSNRSVFAG